MDRVSFEDRTRTFAVDVIRFGASLPDAVEVQVIRRQLVRSGTSVGANYRAACRARSKRDFVAKLAIAEEEADESSYWLEILDDLGIQLPGLERLLREAGELTAMLTASRKTAGSS